MDLEGRSVGQVRRGTNEGVNSQVSVAPKSQPRTSSNDALALLGRLAKQVSERTGRPAGLAAVALLTVVGLVAGLSHAFQPQTAVARRTAEASAASEPRQEARPRSEAAQAPAPAPKVEEQVVAAAAAPAPAPAAPALPAPPRTVAFEGLGTWVDAYDWSRELTRTAQPPVRPEHVDAMHAKGVKTIYLQASMRSPKAPNAILSPDLLEQFIERAHAKGMYVVGWYLPRFEAHDKNVDLLNTLQMKNFKTKSGQSFDAIAVDIEWVKSVPDHGLRSWILVDYSQKLRQSLGREYPVGAITMPPVQTEIVNPRFWPGYPYEQLRHEYDVWMTMGYWTDRKQSSGWRHSYNYTNENIRRLKAHLGPDVKIHPIGGIGHLSSPADYDGFVRSATENGAIGASIYDWATQAPDTWPVLKNTPSPYAQQIASLKAQG